MQASTVADHVDLFRRFVDKHADTVRAIVHLICNAGCDRLVDAAFAAAIKIQAQRIGTGFDGGARVRAIREATDFDFELHGVKIAEMSRNSCYHAIAVRVRCRFKTTGSVVSGLEAADMLSPERECRRKLLRTASFILATARCYAKDAP